MTRATTLLLVTCSLDESRAALACAVVKNLARLIPEANLKNRFILFDNGSVNSHHISLAPPGTTVYRSKRNLGYWSALNWVLDESNNAIGKSSEYIYIVESDLMHLDLTAIEDCEKFLDQEQDASCVRTQEFSVRFKFRYDKRLSFLPFYIERSAISLRNAITGEKAWFRKTNSSNRIFLSNLHAKLPALNRISTLRSVFGRLAAKESFTENDFFSEVYQERRLSGVLDGGLYHSIASPSNSKDIISSSWTNPRRLEALGYHETRRARILDARESSCIDKILM
jgi:hypothetical protein